MPYHKGVCTGWHLIIPMQRQHWHTASLVDMKGGARLTTSNRQALRSDVRQAFDMLKLLVSNAVLIPSARRQRIADTISGKRDAPSNISLKLSVNCDRSTAQPTFARMHAQLKLKSSLYCIWYTGCGKKSKLTDWWYYHYVCIGWLNISVKFRFKIPSNCWENCNKNHRGLLVCATPCMFKMHQLLQIEKTKNWGKTAIKNRVITML